jgi:hypothetical protein
VNCAIFGAAGGAGVSTGATGAGGGGAGGGGIFFLQPSASNITETARQMIEIFRLLNMNIASCINSQLFAPNRAQVTTLRGELL